MQHGVAYFIFLFSKNKDCYGVISIHTAANLKQTSFSTSFPKLFYSLLVGLRALARQLPSASSRRSFPSRSHNRIQTSSVTKDRTSATVREQTHIETVTGSTLREGAKNSKSGAGTTTLTSTKATMSSMDISNLPLMTSEPALIKSLSVATFSLIAS